MWHFIGGQIVGIGIGFVVGCFTPAIGRKVVAWVRAEEVKIKSKL